jgi:hypothetical protein
MAMSTQRLVFPRAHCGSVRSMFPSEARTKQVQEGWGVPPQAISVRLEQPSAFSLSGDSLRNAASAVRPQ